MIGLFCWLFLAIVLIAPSCLAIVWSGALTPHSVKIVVGIEYDSTAVSLYVRKKNDPSTSLQLYPLEKGLSATDLFGGINRISVTDLDESSHYEYGLVNSDESEIIIGKFSTPSAEGQASSFSVGFSSW